ncbi:MAG TPA: hypothetical protein VNU71_09395 [Burkholderiaceae bacterium]|nr:hypothetical protein [Burkholderiaceae bacterium]
MIDRLFTALLTFGTLVCGTIAIASAMVEGDFHTAVATTPVIHVIQPEHVVIVGQRAARDTTLAQGDASETGDTPVALR